MIAFVKDMNRFWLFATPAFLFQIFAVWTCDQTTAANNAAPTSESKCASVSGQIDFDRLLASAQQGDAGAKFWSGVAFEQGWCGTLDLTEALQWYTLSAAQDNADAENSLGKLHENGGGVKPDYILAAAWYRKAAEHVPDLGGAGQGRNNLGWLYLQGLGVPQDYVLAYMWFRLARSEFGLSAAKRRMTREGVVDGEQLAKAWLKAHSVQ
jgi:TPR repeat protein